MNMKTTEIAKLYAEYHDIVILMAVISSYQNIQWQIVVYDQKFQNDFFLVNRDPDEW